MEYCKIKKLIHKDINNLCFSLSNSNQYDSTETFTNIKIASEKALELAGTLDTEVKYNVIIGELIVNLWVEAEKDLTISNNIILYGKDKYLAAVLVYLSANYSTIIISNNIKTYDKCTYVISESNLLEHRIDNEESKVNSYNLSFTYKVNQHGYLVKTEWTVLYNFLQSTTIQTDFIDACKSSWVNNILVAIK